MKKFFYLSMLFLILGVWLGLNYAQNQPFFSNPFVEQEIAEKAAEKVERATKGVKDATERTIDKAFPD